jgi:hypothetical protein
MGNNGGGEDLGASRGRGAGLRWERDDGVGVDKVLVFFHFAPFVSCNYIIIVCTTSIFYTLTPKLLFLAHFSSYKVTNKFLIADDS